MNIFVLDKNPKKAAQLQEKLREGLMKHLAMKIEEDKEDAEHNKNDV